MDLEEMILSTQDSQGDDCSSCEYLEKCRAGEWVKCPWCYAEELQ